MKNWWILPLTMLISVIAEGSYLVYKPAKTWGPYETLPLQKAELNETQVRQLQAQGLVVEKDQPVYLLQSDRIHISFLSDTGSVPPVWPMAAMRVTEAHQLPGGRGENVRVCLVDSGVNHQHPALQGAIRDGRNFTSAAKYDLADPTGHGTAMATLIAGREIAGQKIGVAPEAQLLVAKVVGNDGQSSLGNLAAGFRWCMERSQVINLSLGYSQMSEIMKDMVAEAFRRGITVVTAAGNDPRGVLPSASNPGSLAVGAINSQGQLSAFSARGPILGMLAPGELVPVWDAEGRVTLKSGTSVAAALTTGVEAIRRSRGAARLVTRPASDREAIGVIDAFATATSTK